MTFVHSWCHNVRSTAHAEADIHALAEVGIRARHSCGWPQGLPDTEWRRSGADESLARDWASWSNEGLITLGMAWRGQFRAGPIRPEIYQPEFDNARRLGLPITVHVASARKAVNQIAPLYRAKLMGKDVQTHPCAVGEPAELDMILKSGSPVIGVARLGAAHRLRISADRRDAGQGHPARHLGRYLGAHRQFKPVRRAQARPRHGKRQGRERVQDDGAPGARTRHHRQRPLDGHWTTGSVRSHPASAPTSSPFQSEHPDMGGDDRSGASRAGSHAARSNIDTVVVNGRILKRSGKLAALDPATVIADARAALAGVRARTQWR